MLRSHVRPSAILGLILAAAWCGAADPAAEIAALKQRGFTVSERGGTVTGLSGSTMGFTPDDFRAIAGVTTLTTLNLGGAPGVLTDEAVGLLAPLSGLTDLVFNSAEISDDGFKRIAGFTKLRSLNLFHPSRGRADFTGAGIVALAELPDFESLTIAGGTVGDAALAAVAKLPHLHALRLWHNLETVDGLRQLAALTGLRKLTLGQRLVGRPPTPPSLCDAALPAIAQLQSLEELSLQEARLGYDALLKLKDLPKLKKLTVAQVDTPAADVERLRAALPGVTIDWKPLTAEQAQTMVDKLKL